MATVRINESSLIRLVENGIDRKLDLFKANLLKELERLAPHDTGKLSKGFSVEIVGKINGNDLALVIFNETHYAPFVIYGTNPARVPPSPSLSRWAMKRGLDPFAISKSISSKGVAPHSGFMLEAIISAAKLTRGQ